MKKTLTDSGLELTPEAVAFGMTRFAVWTDAGVIDCGNNLEALAARHGLDPFNVITLRSQTQTEDLFCDCDRCGQRFTGEDNVSSYLREVEVEALFRGAFTSRCDMVCLDCLKPEEADLNC